MKPQLAVGAISSGSGKTTFTMGILRALQRQGLQVQSFKCGPDYIDTRFHSIASGRESVNLDTWLSSEGHVKALYSRYGADADACVVEGVMGLFDGYERMNGSTAEIARLLDIPVLLVINARSMAYTVAAQLHGMKTFLPGLRIAGVVFNHVSSESHFRFLSQACDDAGLRCFGCIPKAPGLEIPSRHLGLTLSAEQEMNVWIDRAADLIEAHIDMKSLLDAVRQPFAEPGSDDAFSHGGMRIAVARDAAFNFIYRENLAALGRMGELHFFSPLAGDSLPEAELLYLPGGYPELFAAELASRKELMSQIRGFVGAGGRVFAECGGMIYLSQGIEGVEGGPFPMCGVLPFSATMAGARLHLGYRHIVTASGQQWRGHEFHYSELTAPGAVPSIARQYNARGEEVATPLYRYKNLIAGYTHFYWGESDILKLWEQ